MARDLALGKRLYLWRTGKRIKQMELASNLGITRQRLWDWETRGVPTCDSVLLRLAVRELDRQTSSTFDDSMERRP